MLPLGFSAGLPFLLVFSTLTAWLRQAGVDHTDIGFFTWIGILYSIKVLWAPVVDRVPLPFLGRWLGKRRSWLFLAQCTIAVGLFLLAQAHPAGHLWAVAGLALLVAFGSATQDISLDAYRIEAVDEDWQAAMASTYVLGYRLAILATGAGALYIADFMSWRMAYMSMAGLALIGPFTTLLVREPEHAVPRPTAEREARVTEFIRRRPHWPIWLRDVGAELVAAVVCPFTDFVMRFGKLALPILLLVGLFKVSDISMAAMANPLYIDTGFSLSEIASITKVFGVIVTIVGGFAGGLLVARFGTLRMLLAAAICVAASNLLYAWLAGVGHSIPALALVISADNFSNGLGATVFIAWLSGLTSRAYTATQYALFSSLMTLPGKLVGGFSGVIVDGWGYPTFFVYSALIGAPTVALIVWLMRRRGAFEAAHEATS